mgnify:CR=1 FL=1|tara:strand:- start:837 stop:1232 length:396 start_codon:yes stop_codon:yes gene_type:complete
MVNNLTEELLRIKRLMGINEGLHDTYWENSAGDKITLIDLLKVTKYIPVEEISIDELEPHLLELDDVDDVDRIGKSDLQYPILTLVSDGKITSIIDGHHRIRKAINGGLETIKGKKIPITTLPKAIRTIFE